MKLLDLFKQDREHFPDRTHRYDLTDGARRRRARQKKTRRAMAKESRRRNRLNAK